MRMHETRSPNDIKTNGFYLDLHLIPCLNEEMTSLPTVIISGIL